MPTRDEVIYKFMLALASNPAIVDPADFEPEAYGEDQFDVYAHRIYRMAAMLAEYQLPL
jgi:hypothetical protein